MGNRQVGGIALKAGATLTGLGTLATLAIFVARATDNSSITNYNRGYGPFAAALSPAPTTTPDDLVRPTAAPAASPTPGTPAMGAAMSSATAALATGLASPARARAALAVLTPSASPSAVGPLAPPTITNGPTTNGPAPPAPSPPWTLSPMPSPTPTSGLPPWRPDGPNHEQPAIHGHGDPQRGAHGHGPFGPAGNVDEIDPATDPATMQGPAPAPQPPTFQSDDGSPNAPGGHKAKDPMNAAVEPVPDQG